MSIWTEPRVETLKTMWADGCSATQIADELDCGLSRNAVIGKVHRLRLPGRKRKSSVVLTPRKRKVPTKWKPERKIDPPRKRLEDGALPPLAIVAPEVFTDKHFVTLMQLENHHCRFPCWQDDVPFDKKFFCGTPTADLASGRAYCGFHSRIAFTTAAERKPQKYWRAA